MKTLGTILFLKNGTKKVMIISRGAVITLEEGKKFFDYCGVLYPEGINPEEMVYFNEEDIEKIVYEGYEDEEELRFREIYNANVDKIKENADI